MQCLKERARYLFRIALFAALTGIMAVALGWFFQPVWKFWNNYNTMHGFYEEPENTIETIFLGASITACGFSVTELYESYGICAYNLGTEQQPVLASYYWLEEAYQRHSDTLRTVVLDCSMLRRSPDLSFYRKALDGMHFSDVKCRAVKDYTDIFEEDFLSCLVPLFSYHDRWSALERSDFEKIGYQADTSVRGYHFLTARYMDAGNYDTLAVPAYLADGTAEPSQFHKESLWYLKKMIDFCSEKGIRLVLMKTPVISSWSSCEHRAAEMIAQQYGLSFFDFNFEPYITQMGYHHALDSADGGHMNYYGATKLTAWFGEYLSRECGALDRREDASYAFMEEELGRYQGGVKWAVQMKAETDPLEYLTAASGSGRTVLVAVKEDAAQSLTPKQRTGFAGIGLEKLSGIAYGDAYLAVIEDGRVTWEQCSAVEKKEEPAAEGNSLEGLEFPFPEEGENDSESETKKEEGILSYQGHSGSIDYALKSGGQPESSIASCVIDGAEYAPNQRGLNIVVYDNEEHQVIDAACFDTCAASQRAGEIQTELNEALNAGVDAAELAGSQKKLYLYNRRCERAREAALLGQETGADGLWQFLMTYWDNEDDVLFLSVSGDAAGALDARARKAFQKIGLLKFSVLEEGDSYLAVVDAGKTLLEKRRQNHLAAKVQGAGYRLVSGGRDTGVMASAVIDGVEYALGDSGVNVIVFDKVLGMVVNRASFDTGTVPVRLPD